MFWLQQLFGSFLLIVVVLAGAVSRPALACDPNKNCLKQECSGGGKCIEVTDQVCEAHRAACTAFPPPSRNPASAVGNSTPPSPSGSRQVTQQRSAASPGPPSVFESFDTEQKQKFVNLVANEWLVRTESMPK